MCHLTSHRTPLDTLAPELPRDLATIVHKAMTRDPAARYASAADLADDLHRFLENRPIKARRGSAAVRFRRWCRRNPVVAALTLAVFVLGVKGFASPIASVRVPGGPEPATGLAPEDVQAHTARAPGGRPDNPDVPSRVPSRVIR